MILLGRGRASRNVLNEGLSVSARPLRIRIETHTVGSACALAREGAGIAIVNEMLAAQYVDKELVMRRFAPNIQHDYGFMVSANTPMTRVTERFRSFCRDFFEKNRDPAVWSATSR